LLPRPFYKFPVIILGFASKQQVSHARMHTFKKGFWVIIYPEAFFNTGSYKVLHIQSYLCKIHQKHPGFLWMFVIDFG